MRSKFALLTIAIALVLLSFNAAGRSQSGNLLQNPNASLGTDSWRVFGKATVETWQENSCFVVRDGGYFIQDVELPDDAVGEYVLFLGFGSSERVNADGAITGLPYLYGYMMPQSGRSNSDTVLEYLQGQRMRAQATSKNEWVSMWGIFKVPKGTKRVRFFLNQALRAGVPHNGSAARFDDLGLYLFATKEEAEAYVAQVK